MSKTMILSIHVDILNSRDLVLNRKRRPILNIHEAIKTRRTIPLVSDQAVPANLIEKIIEAGTYAPNHHRTEPWRFFVLQGEGRMKLGKVLGEITSSQQEDPLSESSIAKIERSERNPLARTRHHCGRCGT